MLLIYTYTFLACVFLIPLHKSVDVPRLLHHSVFLIFNPVYTKLGLDIRFILFWMFIYVAGFFVCIGLMGIVDRGDLRRKIRILTKSFGITTLDYLILIFVPVLIGVALFLRFLSEPLLCVGFILITATIFDQISLSRLRRDKGRGYGKLILVVLIGLLILVISLSSFAYLFPLEVEKTFQLGQRHHFILQKDDSCYYWQPISGREIRLGKGETEAKAFLRNNVTVLESIKSMIRKKATITLALATSYDLTVLKDNGYYYYRGDKGEKKLAWRQENTIRYLMEHPELVDEMNMRIAKRQQESEASQKKDT